MNLRRLALFVLLSACIVAITLVIALRSTSHESNLQSNPPTGGVTTAMCHSVNGLPDPSCTPGVVDPRVTQDNISATICVSGYTKIVRPRAGYTHDLKVRQIKEYGYADTSLASYEEDHLISLELGGHPSDPKNLWP